MAGGVPINSLQDLLLLRELRDQADPFKSGIKALAQGVSAGIAERQEEAKANKQREANFAQFSKIAENNTNSGKLIKKLSIEPLTGKTKFSLSLPTEAEKKIQRESKIDEDFRLAVKENKSSTEIGRQFPGKAKEIAELEELNILSPQGAVPIPGQVPGVQQVQADGTVGGGQPTTGQDRIITEVTPQGRAKTTISKSGKIAEQETKAVGKVRGTQFEQGAKSLANFNRVKQASIGMVSAAKRVFKEQGGFGFVQGIKGKVKRAAAKSGLVKVAAEDAQAGRAELIGQTQEMVLSLSPILTNQNRVIQGVLEMLGKTIPDADKPTTGAEFTAQLKQTTQNAFRLSFALSAGALTVGEIEDLNKGGTQEEIVSTMRDVMARSTVKEEADKFFKEQWGEILNSPASVAEDIFADREQQPLQINSVTRN